MQLNDRIAVLGALGQWLSKDREELAPLIENAYWHNKWFTIENINQSLDAIANNYLAADKLRAWTKPYNIAVPETPKKIGLIMAGNIPLVGFHDLLCVLISGYKAQIKLSSKDKLLPIAIIEKINELSPEMGAQIEVVERLQGFDAVIATGSDNSSRYFEYYFGKYPHIIRKNRNSVAILNGNESPEELYTLGQDVFHYFGLGCRNVSFIMVPKGFDMPRLLDAWVGFDQLMDHNKYKNNYDYQRTLLLMNNIEHYAADFVMLRPIKQLASPITTVHYIEYDDIKETSDFLKNNAANIQCVVGQGENALPFGQAQNPELWDYADDVDTLAFLVGL